MITACQIRLTYEVVGCVCHKTKVVPGELLFRNTCDDVPTLILVICIQYRSIAMLCQSFLTNEISSLDIFAISICCNESELGEFIVWTELLIVSESIGIVERSCSCPSLAKLKSSREDIMILPEVICSLVPIRAVAHLESLCRIGAVITDNQSFIEGVKLTKAYIPHVFIGLDASLAAIGTVHDTQVVGTSCHTVPSLTCTFEVSDILIAYLKLFTKPCQPAIVASAAT